MINMNLELNQSKYPFYLAITLALCALAFFLFKIDATGNPLIIALFGVLLLTPFIKDSFFAKRIVALFSATFAIWLVYELGLTLLPFVVAGAIAFLLDPLVSRLAKKKFPRWVASLLIVVVFVAIVSAIAIFVFPAVFSQLDDAIKKLSSLVTDFTTYIESRKFYREVAKLGLPQDDLRNLIKSEFVPKLEGIFNIALNSLMSLLTQLSLLGAQIINAILIPIITFYLLKDMPLFKSAIGKILAKKNQKVLDDISRINKIFRKYASWQLTSALIVGCVCSTCFTLLGLPYPIMLGTFCGLLNPIPYLGSITSMAIGSVTILIFGDNVGMQIITLIAVIASMHFINAYILEPNIAGKQVGVHPVLLILALFVFGHLFGFIGLLFATPITAVLMMFFNDWRSKYLDEGKLVMENGELIIENGKARIESEVAEVKSE